MGDTHFKGGAVVAADGFKVGNKDSKTVVIDSAGMFSIGTSKVAVVSAAPSATILTAAQSGSIVVVSATGANTVTLPSAAAGLQFRLVVGASGSAVTVKPGSGDKLIVKDATGGYILTATNAGNLGVTSATPNSGAGMILTAISDSAWLTIGAVGGWATT